MKSLLREKISLFLSFFCLLGEVMHRAEEE